MVCVGHKPTKFKIWEARAALKKLRKEGTFEVVILNLEGGKYSNINISGNHNCLMPTTSAPRKSDYMCQSSVKVPKRLKWRSGNHNCLMPTPSTPKSSDYMCQSSVKVPKRFKWSYAHHIVKHSIPFRMRPKRARSIKNMWRYNAKMRKEWKPEFKINTKFGNTESHNYYLCEWNKQY